MQMFWVMVFTLLSCGGCLAFNHFYEYEEEWPIELPSNFRLLPPSPETNFYPYYRPALQSPINIRSRVSVNAYLPRLEFEDLVSSRTRVTMRNTGSTVEFDIADDSVTRPRLVGGPLSSHGEFEFNNLHIHWGTNDVWGGEHQIDSRRYAIEGHCVHYNLKYGSLEAASRQTDGLAVIAFFGKASRRDNPQIERLIRLLPNITVAGTSVPVTAQESLGWFGELAKPTNYFTYPGSLTTPPYSENVFWIVYPRPMYISSRQVEAFRNLMTVNGTILRENIRPIQAFNNRPLLFAV